MSNVVSVLLIYVLVLMLPLLIGIYVYRDAKRRGMNAALWTLIAILAPSLIGFIIYLLIRGNYSDMKCPNCDTRVTEQFVVCPKCGTKLRPSCPNCMTAIESDWKVCPKCAQPLPEYQDDIQSPVRRKDNALWKILILLIVVPIVLILILIVLFSVSGSSGGIGMAEIGIEDYLEAVDEPKIEAWLEDCDKNSEEAYVLKYMTEKEEYEQVRYLVYIPEITEKFNYAPNLKTGLFGTTLEAEFENVDGATGNRLILLTCTGDSDINLKLKLDDEKLEYEMIEVDYSVALSDYAGDVSDDNNSYEYEKIEVIDE